VVVLAAIILVCLAAISASARQRDAWEYHVSPSDSSATLNTWGKDGWEVVAVYTWNNEMRVMMKRRAN
jgi:hypothetical protein